jgi:hypothetical protein
MSWRQRLALASEPASAIPTHCFSLPGAPQLDRQSGHYQTGALVIAGCVCDTLGSVAVRF